MKFVIQTAGQTVEVEAVNPRHAVMTAVVGQMFDSFGALAFVEEKGNADEDKIFYFDPFKLLRDAGFEVKNER